MMFERAACDDVAVTRGGPGEKVSATRLLLFGEPRLVLKATRRCGDRRQLALACHQAVIIPCGPDNVFVIPAASYPPHLDRRSRSNQD